MKNNIILFRAKGTARAGFLPRLQWQAFALARAHAALPILALARRTMIARWQRNPATGQMECQWSVQIERACSANDEPPPRKNAVALAYWKHGRRLGRCLHTHVAMV